MANKKLGSEAKLQKYGVFFVIPFIVIYLFFQLWPTIYTVFLSFTDKKGFNTGLHGSIYFERPIEEVMIDGDVINEREVRRVNKKTGEATTELVPDKLVDQDGKEIGKIIIKKNGKKFVGIRVCSHMCKNRSYKKADVKTTDKFRSCLVSKCKGVHLIGGENFVTLVKDKYFWGSVGNTFIMWLFNFAPQLGIALLFAIWFTDPRMHLKGKNTFRALFYMPNLLTAASVAILFKSLFGYPNGPINQFLYGLGIHSWRLEDGKPVEDAIQFFRSIPWSRGIVSFIQWWLWCGQTLIMLMAGITSISPSLYESAVVDGANQGQQTFYITLPLLRPMMLFILITSLIGGMQLFEIPFLLTDMRGGPAFSIRSMIVYMYNLAFQGTNTYGYGSAIAMGVFIITMFLSMLIYFFMQDRSDMGRK